MLSFYQSHATHDNTYYGIDNAVYNINKAMLNDSNYNDLSDQLLVSQHDEPSQSGLQEHDYPQLSDEHYGLEAMHEIVISKRIPLPPELAERFAYMQANCLMGLFPAIKRAWLSIDSDIFIWNYEDGTDVAYFDGLSETILSVGLVKPKPGIFLAHIAYLLCLTTPVDIVLLGVSFLQVADPTRTGHEYDEMHLLPEPLFTVPTDNVHMLSIASTETGRIFMAGKDGCLYELAYKADDGWFSRKCRKINHSQGKLSFMVPSFFNFSLAEEDPLVQISIDHSRNVLYTRSDKGTIQVFDLGEKGESMKKVASVSLSTTSMNASLIARTMEPSNFQKLVHIAAISAAESSNIHLVAVTHTGARLYFAVSRFGKPQTGFFGNQLTSTPSFAAFCPEILSLVHVRLPPGFTASCSSRPSNVHNAYYSQGVLLLLSANNDDSDLLWIVSSESFPFRPFLSESHESVLIDGRSWAVNEIPCDVAGSLLQPSVVDKSPRPDPPAVVTQHLQIERRFVIINSQGTYILMKQSPVEQLHQLLVTYGADSAEVKAYFRLHQEQASATCLVLMCSRSVAHQQVIDLARRAFFLYSGRPELCFAPTGTPLSPGTTADPTASTPYQGVVPRQLSFQTPNASIIPSSGNPEIQFSNKHRGLCLYLARILRPIWDTRMVIAIASQYKCDPNTYLSSQFNSEQLQWILRKLNNLRDFVDCNSFVGSCSLSDSVMTNRAVNQRMMLGRSEMHPDEQIQRRHAEAEMEENSSLKQLQLLITTACEYLGLWKILCDHQFHIIARDLPQDQDISLRIMTFQQLITSGSDICKCLIKRLIDMYISDSAATDAISERLRQVCPSLYSCADEIYSRANERLNAAKKAVNVLEQQRLINEALESYKEIATHVDLPTACSNLASVRCYRGIVDLVLCTAPKRDPQNLALHFYNSGKPEADVQGKQAYNLRKDCYKCIMETLEYLLSVGQQAPNVPRVPGPPPVHDVGHLSGAEAEQYAEDVFSTSLTSQDEMFHVALYDWLLSKNMPEKLLNIKSPYLEAFLKQSVQTQPDNLGLLDLTWKYYEKQRNFAAAARVLVKLAEKQTSQLRLQQRLEYLSRAAMCAKSVTCHVSTPGDGEFLHELEDKMEVARVQNQIVEALKPSESVMRVNEAIARLNSQLFDISVLYSEFADVFNLSECKLAIIVCADHHDPGLVEGLWQEIIDKEGSRSELESMAKAISSKLVTLGRMYASSENYFPVAYLVKYLEQYSARSRLYEHDQDFVYHSMMDVGITLRQLLDVYDRLFKSKDPIWRTLGRAYHLLFVIADLLNEFAIRPTVVAAYERRAVAVLSLDTISQYLVELNADASADKPSQQLMDRFRQLQLTLERLL